MPPDRPMTTPVAVPAPVGPLRAEPAGHWAEQVSGVLLTLLVIASQVIALISGDHPVGAAIGTVAALTCAISLWTMSADRSRRSARTASVLDAAVAVTLVAAAAAAFPSDLVTLPAIVLGIVRVVRRAGPRTAASALVAVGVALAVTGIGRPVSAGDVVACVLALGGSALFAALGRQIRVSRARDRDLLAQEVQIQAERAQNAALRERARIARDLHDVLAHSLGALGLQLEAAEMLSEAGRHEEARDRVARARALAADGLRESRDVVAALRGAGAEGPEQAVERLVADHREAGGQVTLTLRREPDREGGAARPSQQAWSEGISPEVADTCVRAVQELLTNARRHAPGASVDLELSRSADHLTLTGTDTAPGVVVNDDGGGAGLRGMRERCEALGGTVRVTATDDGRFRVVAEVPTLPQDATDPGATGRMSP